MKITNLINLTVPCTNTTMLLNNLYGFFSHIFQLNIHTFTNHPLTYDMWHQFASHVLMQNILCKTSSGWQWHIRNEKFHNSRLTRERKNGRQHNLDL